MTRHNEYVHSGLIAPAIRKAIACGARDNCGDNIDAAVDALSVADGQKEEQAIRDLIDTLLSIEVNSAIYTWEQARTADERRDARRDLTKIRAWANEIARDCGIPARSRMVR